MAKISLRAYDREIEGLIDHNQLDEAVAHCKYILKSFPKHVETYRLLGKAFLEARRYAEAADIFQRVLNSVPDDFIAHLGLSLINDEQKDLNAAIWHMERAFEIQPSNPALQGELRRLYARRDGMEPPKIRLTRGALAQMYAKGEQYEQAIAEIRAVLAEDPNRPDLQVLLALVFFKAGQKVEATEMCTTLLKKYPYCLDANRVMVEILPTTGRAEDTKVHRHRVNALEPYSAFVTGSVFNIADVADAAVTLDKYEWEPTTSVPAWNDASRLGLDSGLAQQAQPEWLKQAGTSTQASASTPQASASSTQTTTPTQTAEDIPDWMRAAGWGPTTGEAEEGPIAFEEPQVHTGDLAQADIPDWLKSMAPPGAFSTPLVKPQVPVSGTQPLADEDLNFLKDLGVPGIKQESESPRPTEPPEIASSDAAAEPDWLKGLSAVGGSEVPSPKESEAPAGSSDEPEMDWLKGLAAASDIGDTTAPPVASPAPVRPTDEPEMDWLKNLEDAGGTSAMDKAMDSLPSHDINSEPPTQPMSNFDEASDDMNEWLKGLGQDEQLGSANPAPSEEFPDWLKDTGTLSLEAAEAAERAMAEKSKIPDWLQAAKASAENGQTGTSDQSQDSEPLSPLTTGPGTSATEQDESLSWLESLAAKQGAKSEELLTNPDERLEQAPDWISKVDDDRLAKLSPPERPAVESEPLFDEGQPIGELSPLVSGPGTSEAERDDAMSWLESLASKQGAKPEELITRPETRHDNPPEWVNKVGEEATKAPTPPSPGPDTPKEEENDRLKFLDALAPDKDTSLEGASTKSDDLEEEVPDWVQQIDSDTPMSATEPQDETLAWLNNLASGSDESIAPAPQPAQDEDTLNWLDNLAAGEDEQTSTQSAGNESPPSPLASEDVSTWLQQLDETEKEQPSEKADVAGPAAGEVSEEPAPVEEMPEWLQDTEKTGSAESPTAGTDLPEWLRKKSGDQVKPTPVVESKWMPEKGVSEISFEVEPPLPPPPPVSTPSSPPPTAPSKSTIEPTPPPTPSKSPTELKPPPPEKAKEAEPLPKKPAPPKSRPPSPPPNIKESAVLEQAQTELAHGNLDEAMQEYAKLIKRGKLLEEVTHDLREALYRHPVDVVVWQTLGDAYMRSNRLQEALDAYTKAEELLR
jgi:tetratricopeptide (TPR) repeat protein